MPVIKPDLPLVRMQSYQWRNDGVAAASRDW